MATIVCRITNEIPKVNPYHLFVHTYMKKMVKTFGRWDSQTAKVFNDFLWKGRGTQ